MITIPKLVIEPIPIQHPDIVEAVEKNQLVTGPHIEKFECALSERFGFNYASTVSNGFSALFLSIKSLGIENGNIVVPASSTCQAISNAVLATNNTPVFCEVDLFHFSLSETYLGSLVAENKIDLIVAPSHFGIPAPINSFKKWGIPVLEDACQAFYTRTVQQSKADILVLSFYPTKQFNCIEGGAILTNNNSLYQDIANIRYYDQQIEYDGKARYNLRMPNFNALIGLIKLERIDKDIERLHRVKSIYLEGVENNELWLSPQIPANVIPWRLMMKGLNDRQINELQAAGVKTDLELAWIADTGQKDSLKKSHQEIRSIPFHRHLSAEDQHIIFEVINKWN